MPLNTIQLILNVSRLLFLHKPWVFGPSYLPHQKHHEQRKHSCLLRIFWESPGDVATQIAIVQIQISEVLRIDIPDGWWTVDAYGGGLTGLLLFHMLHATIKTKINDTT